MAEDPARRPQSPVVVASNTALITGVVLIVVGIFLAPFILYVGIFLLAVAIGLTVFNRTQRTANAQRNQQ